jgi:hypothetical protein
MATETSGISNDTKTIVTVLLLIFAYPVGVIVMWAWPKWVVWVKFLVSLPIVIVLFAISFAIVMFSGLLIQKEPIPSPTPIPLIEKSTDLPPAKVKYVFDVPSFVGKDMTGLTKELGVPEGKNPTGAQIQKGVAEWSKTFTKDGEKLLVTYVVTTGKVVEFYLETNDPSGKTQDKKLLLEMVNAKEDDSLYSVEFVEDVSDSASFTGIKIIPK